MWRVISRLPWVIHICFKPKTSSHLDWFRKIAANIRVILLKFYVLPKLNQQKIPKLWIADYNLLSEVEVIPLNGHKTPSFTPIFWVNSLSLKTSPNSSIMWLFEIRLVPVHAKALVTLNFSFTEIPTSFYEKSDQLIGFCVLELVSNSFWMSDSSPFWSIFFNLKIENITSIK